MGPVLGPQPVSDPSEQGRDAKEDDGAGDQLVDVEGAANERTAQMGCQSGSADADEEEYGLNEPDGECLKRGHHATRLAAHGAAARDARHLGHVRYGARP